MTRTYTTLMSARVVVEGLAVAGIMWLASTVTEQNLAIARLQTQMASLNASLSNVPTLAQQVAQLETAGVERDRRITRLEDRQK